MASPFPYGQGDTSDDSDNEHDSRLPVATASFAPGIEDGASPSSIDKHEDRHEPRAPPARKPRHSMGSRGHSFVHDMNRLSFMPSAVREGIKAKDKKEGGHVMPRLFLCALAVTLLWSTSLIIAREIVVKVIPKPGTDLVLDKVEIAFDLTNLNKDGYKDCAGEKKALCERQYSASVVTETARLEEIRQRNWVRLATYSVIRETCEENYSISVARYKDYMELLRVPRLPDQSPYFVQNRDSLPDSDLCSKLDDILAGNEEGVNALQTADSFTEETDGKFLEQTEALALRIKYDNDYLAMKTAQAAAKAAQNSADKADLDARRAEVKAAREQAALCLDPPPSPAGDICDASVAGQFGAAGAGAQAAFGASEGVAAGAFAGINGDYGDVNAFYAEYLDMLAQIDDAGLVDNLPGIPTGHSNLGAAGTFPSWNIDVQGSIDAKIAEARKAMQDAANARLGAITNYDQGIAAASLNLQGLGPLENFADYDPPDQGGNELSDYRAARDAYMASMETTLNDVQSADVGQIEGSLEKQNSSTVGFVNETVSSLNFREWEFFSYPDIFAQDFFDGWNNIADLTLMFDIVYRLFRTVQIIRKYWNISAVATPPADVRLTASRKETNRKVKKNPIQMAGYVLTHPFFNMVIIIVFFSIISSIFLSLYLPFLNKYIDACSTGDPRDQNGVEATQTGTFITENAYTAAYQYATTDGDNVINAALDEVNTKRQALCEERRSNFSDPILFNSFSAQNTKHVNAGYRSDILKNCSTVGEIDDWVAQEAAVSPTLEELLYAEESCGVEFTAPELQTFDCGVIDTCRDVFNCQGPDEASMFEAVWVGSCYSEWLGHAVLLNFVMAILVFFLLNLSRLILLAGIVRVNWRSLTGAKFGYKATCKENGELIYPEAVTEDGHSFKRVIAKKLSHALEVFTREGYFMIIAALMLNTPWIGMLIYLNGTLSFSPSA